MLRTSLAPAGLFLTEIKHTVTFLVMYWDVARIMELSYEVSYAAAAVLQQFNSSAVLSISYIRRHAMAMSLLLCCLRRGRPVPAVRVEEERNRARRGIPLFDSNRDGLHRLHPRLLLQEVGRIDL